MLPDAVRGVPSYGLFPSSVTTIRVASVTVRFPFLVDIVLYRSAFSTAYVKSFDTVDSATCLIFADSAGVIVTLSPVLRVATAVVSPSATEILYSSSPYVTVYSGFLCSLPSYSHVPSSEEIFSSKV